MAASAVLRGISSRHSSNSSRRGRAGPCDHRDTGLAGRTGAAVFELPQVQEAFRLDGVVAVVDAAHVQASADDVSTYSSKSPTRTSSS